MILHYASDEAVRKIAAHPLMLLGSDGIFGERPHPRVCGTAPRGSSAASRCGTGCCRPRRRSHD